MPDWTGAPPAPHGECPSCFGTYRHTVGCELADVAIDVAAELGLDRALLLTAKVGEAIAVVFGPAEARRVVASAGSIDLEEARRIIAEVEAYGDRRHQPD